MPQRACSFCKLAFPYRTEYEICPGCTGRTSVLLTTDLPDNWEEKVKTYFEGMAESNDETDRIIANRLRRFRDLGYGWDDAAELASAHFGPDKVDVQQVEDLVAAGATLELAARIA